MNLPGIVKNASSLVALLIFAACSGGSAGTPSTAPLNYQYIGKTLFVNGSPVTAARLGATPRYETLVPERHKRLKHFEYVFNFYGSYASIFNYPKSAAMIGQLNGAGGQGCTNALYGYGKKIFWNPGRRGELIDEYQVPHKLLKSLTLDYTITSSCAMNTSGDLAVGILLGNSYGSGGQVAIFKNATGTPTVYKTPLTEEFFNGYDPKGNLFADGFGPSNFMLVELPAGSSKAVTITTSNAPEFPGSVQWDGTYLSVFDQLTSETYQYTVSGTKATLKNTIQYSGVGDCAQTWIVKGMLYCGDAGNGGEVFNYPAGGAPIAQFTGSFDSPLGVVAVKNK
jgi:hypothetical protein